MTGFFDGLRVLGWIAVCIRIGLILSVVMKSHWWFNYEERLPRLSIFVDHLYTDFHIFVFMAVRGIILFGTVWILTSLLIYIG